MVNLKLDNLILIFLVLVLCQCSDHKSYLISKSLLEIENLKTYSIDNNLRYKISFEEQTRYGSTDDQSIGLMAGFTVDDSGRVYISDFHQRTIHVFDDDGNYISQVGREGSGPGEFRMAPIPYISSNQLFVVELQSLIVNKFSIDSFEHIQTMSISPLNQNDFSDLYDAYITQIFPSQTTKTLVSFAQHNRAGTSSSPGQNINKFYFRYYLLNPVERMLSNMVFKYEQQPPLTGRVDGRILTVRPYFFNKPLIAVSDKGEVFSADSDKFLIKKYSPEGDYDRAFYYPFDKVKLIRDQAIEIEISESKMLADEIRADVVQTRIQVINQNDHPDTWPALNDLLVDNENRLWVSTIVEDFDIYEWWVLEESGELITRFEWSRHEPIELVRNSYMYTRETDEETGLQQIVKYTFDIK